MAGWGEIYLEAFRVSKSEEWLGRATWIAQALCTLKCKLPGNGAYWIVENAHFPTADLMLGSSGVIHFLMRYLNQDKILFLLLN